MPRRKFWVVLTTAAISAAVLAGCTPGMSGKAANTAAPNGGVQTDPAKLGKVTVHVLDYFTGGVDNSWMSQVVKQFEAKYPNITISRQSMAWGDVMQALPLKLKSNDPPDIVPANNGWQSLGTLVRGGLVLNLDSYATAYDWRSEVPQSILAEHEFSTDGKKMGTGSLFGMPVARSSMIEVYYNRKLLKQLNLGVPKTYNQFTSALAAAKNKGITPIALGNVEQVGITTPLFSVMNALGNQQTISNIIYSSGTGDLDSQQSGFPQAVSALSSWAKKGYFTKGFAAVAGQDAAQAFVDGKALFHLDYSGSLPLKPGQSKNIGAFILPRNDGRAPVATVSSATNFSVSAKTKHPAAAAAFLNFAASKTAAQAAVKLGTAPMLWPDVRPSTNDPLFADEVKNAAEITTNDSSVPYLDWTTPTLLTTIEVKMQDLLAGKTNTAGVISAAKNDDTKFVKTLAR